MNKLIGDLLYGKKSLIKFEKIITVSKEMTCEIKKSLMIDTVFSFK